MALSIPPNKNLGAGDKWGRWVESALSNFDRSINQLSRNLDSKVRSLNSAISRVSTNLAERVLTQRLVVQQDTDTGSRTTIGFTLDPDSETVTDYPGIWLYPPGDSMGYQATLQIPSSGSPGLFLKDDSGTTRASITSGDGLYLRYANGVNATSMAPGSLYLRDTDDTYLLGFDPSSDNNLRLRKGAGATFIGSDNNTRFRIDASQFSNGVQLYSWGNKYSAVINLQGLSDGSRMQSPSVYHRSGTTAANVVVNSSGTLFRSTSLRKAKLDIQDAGCNIDLLKVPLRTWVDKQELIDRVLGRTDHEGERIIGVVAEELEEVAPELCLYDENGDLSGVAYDRMGAALIPILRKMQNEIEELKGEKLTEWPNSPVYDDTELLDEVLAFGAEPQEEEQSTSNEEGEYGDAGSSDTVESAQP